MKKIGTFSLGFTFAGCFLGAGFVSGQEIWQFFGSFGIMGVLGAVLAFFLHFLFGIMLIKLVHNTKITDMDKIIVWKNIKWLRAAVGAVAAFFMFSILVIMSAGAGALLNRMFNMPVLVGCGIFCLLVAIFTMRGVEGMVSTLSRLVPVMIIGAVIIGIISLHNKSLDFNGVNDNILMQNWLFSAFTYSSHNLFCTIGILTPVALNVDKRTVVKGVAFGSAVMLIIAMSVLFGICANTNIADTELPMLELAYNISRSLGIVYAVLLLFGMFGTSLSSMVGIVEYGEQKFSWFSKYKNAIVVGLSIAGCIFSLFGFSDLIGVVYPISGYFGFGAIIAVVIHYLVSKK